MAHLQNWNLYSKDSANYLNFVIGSERFVISTSWSQFPYKRMTILPS